LRADEVFMRLAPGGTDGHALAITALPLPTAATLAASQITGYRALVQGSVNARDNTTTVRFEYGLDEDYGTTVSATPDTLAGNAETVAGATLRGLLPATSYHFRVVAECAGAVIRGADRTFTTGPPGSPPVFSGYTAAAPYQPPATIGLRKLLSKASDPDGETVAVTAAGAISANGGTVALLADSIRYMPPNNFSGADTFTVVLTDEGGASATGTVTVIVGQAPNAGGIGSNPPKLTVLPDGKVGISFQGIPGRSYTVQRSTGGLGDWQTIATITADAAGRIAFTDESPPPGSAFYRLGLP
jgi:hypothetical protein